MSTEAQTPLGDAGNLLLGSGAVYIDYGEDSEVLLGATKGGSTFSTNKEMRETEQDGAYGPVKGFRDKIRIAPTLMVNLLELSVSNLNTILGGATTTDNTTYDTITENMDIVSGDYLTNVAWVGRTRDGEDIKIILKNVLVTNAIEINATTDKEEVVPEIMFEAHYDPSTPKVPPYEIQKTKSA